MYMNAETQDPNPRIAPYNLEPQTQQKTNPDPALKTIATLTSWS